MPVWRELYGSVKADSLGIHIAGEALDSGEVEVSNACSVGPFPPDLRRSRGIGEEFSTVYQKKGPAVDANVPAIVECRKQMLDVGQVILQ